MYLNDDFDGGATTFYVPSAGAAGLSAYGVQPRIGAVLCFPQGNLASLVHEGSAVTRGFKCVIRTDVLYSLPPAELAARAATVRPPVARPAPPPAAPRPATSGHTSRKPASPTASAPRTAPTREVWVARRAAELAISRGAALLATDVLASPRGARPPSRSTPKHPGTGR